MITSIHIDQLLENYGTIPIFDVRSPSEYNHAHLPGAFSLPIFSDQERAEIGTLYKQVSSEEAIQSGLKFFGPRLNSYPAEVKTVLKSYHSKQIVVHCWRGGMRSAAMAWLLDLCGFEVLLLKGGYKAYRRYVLGCIEQPFQLRVLSGSTGSAKTETLLELKKLGQAVIDLEGIACHKGSAFGALGMPEQPSQEQFENLLIHHLQPYFSYRDEQFKQHESVWVESESQRIGQINQPKVFFERLQNSPSYRLEIPFEARLKHILLGYGKFDTEKLVNAVFRIKKRLGGLQTRDTINALVEGDLMTAFSILLLYYDKQYKLSSEKSNQPIGHILTNTTDPVINANLVLKNLS